MTLVTRSKYVALSIYTRWEISSSGSMLPHRLCTPDWRSLNSDNTPETWDWPEQYPPALALGANAVTYYPWAPRDPNIYGTSADDIKLVCQVRKNLVTNEEQLRFRAVKANNTSLFASVPGGDGGWYYATGAGAGWEIGQTIPDPSSYLSNAGWPTPPMPTNVWDNSVGGYVPMTPTQIANWPGSWANGTVSPSSYYRPIGGRNDSDIQFIDGTNYNYWRILSSSFFDEGYYQEESGTNTNPIAGTLLSTSCTGFDQYGVYADGSGGTYTQLITANSPACGYVSSGSNPSTPSTTIVNGILGCQISTFKAGASWGAITPSPVPSHPTIDLGTSFFS